MVGALASQLRRSAVMPSCRRAVMPSCRLAGAAGAAAEHALGGGRALPAARHGAIPRPGLAAEGPRRLAGEVEGQHEGGEAQAEGDRVGDDDVRVVERHAASEPKGAADRAAHEYRHWQAARAPCPQHLWDRGEQGRGRQQGATRGDQADDEQRPCDRELPHAEELQEEHSADGLEVAVSGAQHVRVLASAQEGVHIVDAEEDAEHVRVQ
mmetsp:Transcript_101217/g.291510  ORF Transcript_101217/g.291510 Transcript_101217/m.291510 type:complete len:210 (-) Transcript_101217:176-805(-)